MEYKNVEWKLEKLLSSVFIHGTNKIKTLNEISLKWIHFKILWQSILYYISSHPVILLKEEKIGSQTLTLKK